MIKIRPATLVDAQKIGSVFDSAVAEGWKYLGELARNPTFLWRNGTRSWRSTRRQHALLVAVNELNELVGYTAVHPREGEMGLLFVHPDHAGHGLVRMLLAAAHDAMRAAGRREVFLYTHEQKKRALEVYETAGHRRDGTIRESNFRGVHLREPRLVKPL